MSAITLKKISEVLGISISTVSRALKNHPDISIATKLKVKELAESLEYEPNTTAVNLRTKKTKIFGLLVPSVLNSFYDSFIAAIEEESRAISYSLLILQTHDDTLIEAENLKFCRQNRVSGVFACYSNKTENLPAFEKMKAAGIPIIFFDTVPEIKTFNTVCLADQEAARLAADALLEKKKKKILALFGDTRLSITQKRMEAFLASFVGHRQVEVITEQAKSSRQAEDLTKQYFQLTHKPDAIFCMSDEILVGAMKSLQEMRVSIPSETGIIALSDGFFPKLYYPEITFVETSGYQLGKLAFERMKDCLDGDSSIIEEYIPSRLIPGGSL